MTLANWIHPLLWSGARFSPLDLPGLVLWLDANQITGVPDGGDISTWLDLSGNARHATQAVAANKSHFQEAYQNGLSVAEFDGVNDWMTLDFSTPVPADDHTLIVAFKQRDAFTNPDQRFFDFMPPAGELSINAITSTVGKIGYWQGAWRHVANAINGAQVIAFQMEAGNASLFRNGVPISAGGALAQRALSTAVSLGANTVGSYPFDGYLFEAIICSPMLSDADHMLAVNCLIAKWDVYGDYRVFDTFTDDDGVLLENHTPEKGGPWIVISGDPTKFKIDTDALWIDIHSTTGWSMAVIDVGEADVIITGNIRVGGRNPGICFRCVDEDNTWILNFSQSAGQLRLFKVTGGGFATIDSQVHAYNFADIVSFRVVISGNNILGEDLTNSHSVSTVDAYLNTITRHGVGENWGFNGVRLYDFFVE